MAELASLCKQADELSLQERESLLAYLVEGLPDLPLGPDDEEVLRRDAELEAGTVQAISHDEFLLRAGFPRA